MIIYLNLRVFGRDFHLDVQCRLVMGRTKSYSVRKVTMLWCHLKKKDIKSKISQLYGCGRNLSSRLIVVLSLHNICIEGCLYVDFFFYLLLEGMSYRLHIYVVECLKVKCCPPVCIVPFTFLRDFDKKHSYFFLEQEWVTHFSY